MEHAELVNKFYFSRDNFSVLTAEDLQSEAVKDLEQSFIYLLNHYEFVAVGIRSGDPDEHIIKQTMQGIVVNLYDFAEVYITQFKDKRPTAFEHLTALQKRWKRK